jgi:CRISPR/Cas system-associated exonuclease Cas4 (RecB family)
MAVIRASEVGEYVYCARAWWLRRVEGLEPAGGARRAVGIVQHTRYARLVRLSSLLLLAAGLLLLAGLALLGFVAA